MAIKLRVREFNELYQLFNSRALEKEDLKNYEFMIWYVSMHKMFALYQWLREHKNEYIIGLSEGFEVDNNQKISLEDIKSQEYLKIL